MKPSTKEFILFIKSILVPVTLEIFFRIVRVPFFPAWALWFQETKLNKKNLIKAAIIILIEFYFFGFPALDFAVAMFTTILIVNSRKYFSGYFYFTTFCTLIWSIAGLITNRFPVGAMEIETILTAVFTRFTTFESVAGIFSRIALASLTYFSIQFTLYFQKKLTSWFPLIFALTLILPDCSEKEKVYFSPETTGQEIYIDFSKSSTQGSFAGHPILPLDQIKNETCISCHSKKIFDPKNNKNEKNPHEIHYKFEKLKIECIYCHENAGKENFVSEFSNENKKFLYNQKCVSCHSEKNNLNWKRKYR